MKYIAVIIVAVAALWFYELPACAMPVQVDTLLHGRVAWGAWRLPPPEAASPVFGAAAFVAVSILKQIYSRFRKLFDIAGSVIALSFLFPVTVVAALLVFLDSPGPVFFMQTRIGLNRRNTRPHGGIENDRRTRGNAGIPFRVLKFRTMRVDAEAGTGPVWASSNDSRVTRIGRLLRKSRIDEVPQFINVLRGEMSIVGPRPERPVFIKVLNENVRGYARRLEIKPGITGLAQVRYRYAATVSDARRKLKYDLLYLRKVSFVVDFWILIATFGTVLFARGAR